VQYYSALLEPILNRKRTNRAPCPLPAVAGAKTKSFPCISFSSAGCGGEPTKSGKETFGFCFAATKLSLSQYAKFRYCNPAYMLIVLCPDTIRTREYADFVGKLRKARLEAGLRQIDVAKKLKRTQSYVSRVEVGEQRLDILELKKFAKLYGKDMNYFVK